MPQKTKFTVEALWDAEHRVWRSKSDIQGLVIEAKTLEDFEEVLQDSAIELILANHWDGRLDPNRAPSEVIPTILWKRPSLDAA